MNMMLDARHLSGSVSLVSALFIKWGLGFGRHKRKSMNLVWFGELLVSRVIRVS